MAMDQNKEDHNTSDTHSKTRGRPLKSGSVKGPMGIDEPSPPNGRARVKEPAKGKESIPGKTTGVSRTSADGLAQKSSDGDFHRSPAPSMGGGDSQEQLSKPEVQLPERTSQTPEALQVTTSKRERKAAEVSRELESGDPIALSSNTKESTEDPEPPKSNVKTEAQAKPAEGYAARKGAKKMSRRKFEKGVTAEEKIKLENTSPSEELKKRVKGTAKEVLSAMTPGKELQDELATLLLQIFPSQEQVKSTVPSQQQINKIIDIVNRGFSEGKTNLDRLLDQIPDHELREQIRAAVLKERKDQI